MSDFSILVGSGLTLVVESVTLFRVVRGSKHRFVIKILVMLIGYNLAAIAQESISINTVRHFDFTMKKYLIYYSFESLGMALCNMAHWMFAHKYFKISRQTEYKLANKKVPRKIIMCDKVTNWIFLILNGIAPILNGFGWVSYAYVDHEIH